jgi:hypothetical protein
MSVDRVGNQYTVRDQNNNPSNPFYIKEGTTSNVQYSYSSNAYMIAHTHPYSQGAITAPSPSDAITLAEVYSKGNVKASNIQASVIFGYDGSEYVIYVNNRNQLKDFCDASKNSNFFEKDGANFKKNSIFDEYYNNARINMKSKGYSENDSRAYALTYVLDFFQTGLKISKKEPGKNDFKEQRTDYSATGSNITYTPKICP